MEIRKIKGKDIIKISRIIKKLNIELSNVKTDKKDAGITGLSFAKMLLENFHLAGDEINDLLADLTGKTKKEIEELEISEYTKIFQQIFSENDILSFFKRGL